MSAPAIDRITACADAGRLLLARRAAGHDVTVLLAMWGLEVDRMLVDIRRDGISAVLHEVGT